ncbi:MAG TPA: 6-bladed beta-propeller [Gemmatimonadales bacterium]
MPNSCRPILAFALLMTVACSGTHEEPTKASTRDSAGVTITETPMATWHGSDGWTVDSTPILDIGQQDGPDPYLLGQVVGAVRRDDGSIIVVDGDAHQLRLFDSTGHFVKARGRKGPGPGEFAYIEQIARCGPNQLWIGTGPRISIWTADLEFVRELSVRQNVMWPLICFGGSGLLAKRDLNNMDDPTTNTTRDDSLELIALDSAGDSPHDLMSIAVWRRIYLVESKPRVSFPNPFAPMTVLAENGADMIVGTARTLGFEVFDAQGRLLRIVRGPAGDLAFTAAMRQDYLSSALVGRDKEDREWLNRAGNPIPATMPAYTEIQTDAVGNVWVNRFASPGSSLNRWGVFGRDDHFLGHVTLPRDLKVFDIGADYLLGMASDSAGAQHVRLYRLRK